MLAELTHQVLLGFTALKCTILIGLLWIASFIPYVRERIQKYEEHHVLVPYQNFWHYYASNKMLSAVLKVVREFEDVADFLIVYICEAHATDEWRWHNNVEIPQHKSLKERCNAAKMLIKISQCPVPVMVDTWSNEATEAYGAFPERLFILQQGQIVYEGGTGPYNYVLPEVRSWLEEYQAKQ
ncbi:hypothetical protein ACROYT_G003546 [Oculina patagonica]